MSTNDSDSATLVSEIQRFALDDPDKDAFIFWDKDHNRTVLSRQEIWDKSCRCAAMLRRYGINKGDVVCNTLPNSQERLITSYGVIFAGAISMHGQMFLADGDDIISNWKKSKCKYIIVDPNQQKGPVDILDRFKSTDNQTGSAVYDGLPFLSKVIPIVTGNGPDAWLNQLNKETETFVEETIDKDDLAFIFTTSGSTGFAKLVPKSHRQLINLGELSETQRDFLTRKSFNIRSLGWVGGAPVAYPSFGYTRVLVDETKGPLDDKGDSYLHIIEYEKVKLGFLLPSDIEILITALDKREQHTLTNLLDVVLTGGSPVTNRSVKAIGRICQMMNIFYGGTEMGLVSNLILKDGDEYENTNNGGIIPFVNVKVMDDNGDELPVGKDGEIYVKSARVADCYYNDPEATRKAFLEDNWYRTSDRGRLTENGELFVYCRIANSINHKGFIHYPGWMEARIDKHPLVKKSAVLGVPDPVNFEDICLCVTKIKDQPDDLTADVMKEYCKSLFLTKEEDMITPIPKYYLILDKFPLNSNGKIDRMGLKKLVMNRIRTADKI